MSVFGEGSIGSRRLILLARAFLLTPAVPRLWQNDAVKIPCLPAALLVLTLPAALGQKPASTQKPAANAVGPVQAELLANLDVRHLQAGKTIFARVTYDWKGPGCLLRKGATLMGTVEQAEMRSAKSESRLVMSFHEAQCNGKAMQPLPLVVTAVAQYPAQVNVQNQGLLKFSTLQANGVDPASHMGAGLASLPVTTNSFSAHLEVVGDSERRFPFRTGIRPGDVIDFKGLKLELGSGTNLSSALTSKTRDVLLPQYTQLLLDRPSSVFHSAASASTSEISALGDAAVAAADPVPAPDVPAPKMAPAAPFNDIEVCAPPGCAVDLPVSAKEFEGRSATSLPLHALGYTPRVNKARAGFEEEESMVWMSPGQLLFAFNPHHLIKRGPALAYTNTVRIIRAVLVDTHAHNVLRAVDWEITDYNRYLWPLSGGRLLVHVGNELRVYGAGLEVEHTIPLDGPLWFVRTSPNGSVTALATLKERHSPELHAKLKDEFGVDPEEDVEMSILDRDFNTLAHTETATGVMAPILLDEGQVRLQAEPKQYYRLVMRTWDNKKLGLARFRSTCMPQVTSAAPNLLFLFSCGLNTGEREYRVLRGDGKLLLRGAADPRDVDDEAIGNDSSHTFVVKVVRSVKPIPPNINFTSADLESAEVRVYRASDAKRLLAVNVRNPAPSHRDYAIAPDGSALAVLSGSEIQFFPVPTE